MRTPTTCCQTPGGFKLSELTDNIREADLKALDEFTRGLNKAIKDARRRLRQ